MMKIIARSGQSVCHLPPEIQKFFRDKIEYTVDGEGFVCDPSDEEQEDDKSEYQTSWYSDEKIKKVKVKMVPGGYQVTCPYCEQDLINPWNPSGDWRVCGNCDKSFYIQNFIFWDGLEFTGIDVLRL